VEKRDTDAILLRKPNLMQRVVREPRELESFSGAYSRSRQRRTRATMSAPA
jgi:hypothetical protein